MKSIRLPSTKSSKLVLALKYVSSSMSTLLSSFSLELQLEYMLLLSVRPIEDCANISRLATTRFTGKHSPDEPNTMNRPRLPDAVGPKISIKAVNLIENVVLSSVFLTSFNVVNKIKVQSSQYSICILPVTTLGTLLPPSLLLFPPIGLATSHERRLSIVFKMRSES